jgi:hypothetical protein
VLPVDSEALAGSVALIGSVLPVDSGALAGSGALTGSVAPAESEAKAGSEAEAALRASLGRAAATRRSRIKHRMTVPFQIPRKPCLLADLPDYQIAGLSAC